MRENLLRAVLCISALGVIPPGLRGAGAAGNLQVSVTANGSAIPRYDIFELTFRHDNQYENPFFDVTLRCTFLAPSGRSVTVGGFFYGSSRKAQIRIHTSRTGRGPLKRAEYIFSTRDLWKVRFAPGEFGKWRYRFTFSNKEGKQSRGEGGFRCVRGAVARKGFLRIDPRNPYRLIFSDSTPFFPVGLQEGWGDWSCTGTALDTKSMEGPFRTDLPTAPPLPSGPLFVRGPSMNPQNADVYCRRYRDAGFNLYRFSQRNNTFDLFRDLDHYLIQEACMTDEILFHLRRYGFRIFYGLFGFRKVFNFQADNAPAMAKVKRFVKYSVDRWGALVDIWELLNEQKASDAWYRLVASYLKQVDPYRHPVATSWERPDLGVIDINAPHWYQKENEKESDLVTARRAVAWKKWRKPVIVGEQGNWTSRAAPRPPGVGGVWDPLSARRMRLRLWSALFNEIALVFWNTSYARDGHNMNIWLGPQERQYVKSLQTFSACLDRAVRPVSVQIRPSESVRAFALASPERLAVYLHHCADHNSLIRNVKVRLTVPKAGTLLWYDPATAAIKGSQPVREGPLTCTAPAFSVDCALLITPKQRPDSDGDTLPNDRDPDDDNDGVADTNDAFPLQRWEWEDADHDLIGDNLDADRDGDGCGDDRNRNGIPDWREYDRDGDGVPRAEAVPWDAFPCDPKNWRDTDADGIGDSTDPDDDNDGVPDSEEKRRGTDPKNYLDPPPRF